MCCLQVIGGTSVQKSSAYYHNTGIYALPNETADDNKDQKVHMYVSTIKYGTVQLQLHTRVICHAWYHALFSVKRKFVTRESEYSHA